MMKLLFLHSDFIEIEPTIKAIEEAENIEKKKLRIEDCLVCFVSVEKEDSEELVEEAVKNIYDVAEKIKAKRIVIYPYVHLTNKPASPLEAYKILLEIEEALKKDFEVYRAPFGWYKSFTIKVKGHPLAELSRTISKKVEILSAIEDLLLRSNLKYNIKREKDKVVIEIYSKEQKISKKIKKPHIILFPDGKEYLIVGEKNGKLKVIDVKKLDLGKIIDIVNENILPEYELLDKQTLNKDMIILIDKEALEKSMEEHEKNPIRGAMERFGFEWELNSDYGHMRYKPYAAIMIDLVGLYSIKIAKELGIPIYVIKGTNMFDLNEGPVAEHAKLFGERMYELETDKSRFVLRYAACFQQFSIAKDLIISYKDLPFGMLEIADSYRFEQSGEVVLGFRLRKFIMPDLHIFCKNIEEAKEQFIKLHRKIMEEIRKIGRDYELLINVGSPEFYKKYKDIILDIARDVSKPVLVSIYPPADERYWIINIEYHIIDILGRPREIATTQIDIGNGKRFGIKYIDEKNQENYVIILHNAILGSIERYIYALFDTALRKQKPTLPLWIAPVQIRIIPVKKEYNKYCYELAEELEKNMIRVEVDDREETVKKKIMDAEKLWVPYIIVVGEREIKNNILSVRKREEGKIVEMKLEELINEILEKTKEYPKIYQYWPKSLSNKPSGL